MNIVQKLKEMEEFSILRKLLKKTHFNKLLKTDGSYTFFAPIDDAFQNLPVALIENYRINKEKMEQLIGNHVLSKEIFIKESSETICLDSLCNSEISIDCKDGLQVNEICIINANIPCDNGIIHIISDVLIPRQKIEIF